MFTADNCEGYIIDLFALSVSPTPVSSGLRKQTCEDDSIISAKYVCFGIEMLCKLIKYHEFPGCFNIGEQFPSVSARKQSYDRHTPVSLFYSNVADTDAHK